MWKAGHSLIKSKMKEEKAPLAGEMSGHMFFADRYFGYDDAIYASLRLLEIISTSGQKISELIRPFEKYATSEEINYKVTDKNAVMQKIEEAYGKQIVGRLDGVSINAGDYWFNVRLSKTENLVRLNCEATTRKKLNMAIEWISKIIQGA